MKTITKELIIGRRVSIDTEENDSVDIKCGGPRYLGYDFIIDADEKPNDAKSIIEEMLKCSNTKYLSVYVYTDIVEVDKESIWSYDRIRKYLKNNR